MPPVFPARTVAQWYCTKANEYCSASAAKRKLKEISLGTLVKSERLGVELNLRVDPALGRIVHGLAPHEIPPSGYGDSKI